MTATLANHWAAKGWKVVIVTVESEVRGLYTLDPRIELVALGMAIGSRHAGQAVMQNLRRIWSLRGIVRRENPDVAVSMMVTANVILALAGLLTGVPTVGSERVHPPTVPLGRIWHSIRRRAYPLLHGLVAQTDASAAWLREHAPTRKIRVIPNPVNYPLSCHEPRVAPSEVLASLVGRRVLLAVGRLELQKGFGRLLTAFAEVSEAHADWSLVILGQGSLHAALIQQADELGIRDRVALPGAVGNVGEWLEAADLYALTSLFEGFPNALLEALAYGVPSVAVDCETGPREIIRDGVDGLLVPQADQAALVSGLNRLMSEGRLRACFAERAVEVRRRFALENIANQWEQLFNECLNVQKQ